LVGIYLDILSDCTRTSIKRVVLRTHIHSVGLCIYFRAVK